MPERTTCTGLTVGPGTYDWTVEHGGRTRAYRVHVPPGYDATRPTPAVLAFHGLGSSERQLESLTGLSTLADTEGFLAVYPRGLNAPELGLGTSPDLRSWNGGACCYPARGVADDVGFVDALLAHLDTRVCVDTRRTFAMGFSNGGFFTYRLACERASRFAAVAPVAGPEGTSPCTPSRPVPVLHFHGTADAVVYYAGGNNFGSFGSAYPSAEESVRRWAGRNGCGSGTVQTYQQGDSTCTAYTGCTPASATVSLCTVQGGRHAWPGYAGFNNGTLDLKATREAWKFFKERPRP
ncbi:alpha/beta hydrolase family esterase [Pyxidicoccus trucidator]|uniref:extracellular catalytic domain type 1 short-chain-length polyhydroxyalkanoate depolymerase n=1 Tax=Pyxidicoccus trucidator TaxID=2709662 RepID=UPI001F075946|nr:PHB depolymerase family esterase [Pyxidicoccus trucidator]